jgi:hypothetical protein
MVSVEQLIGELLLRHNCVIIPSFGGFVAKQASATIDYKTGLMTPPRKSLLFNRQLINNDGLLVAELAVSNSINYNEAIEIVGKMVSSWGEKLRRGERITIDKVGFLFFDQEKNICFEQDRFFNLLLESYGLGKVHFLTEKDVQQAQRSSIEQALDSLLENESSRPSAIVFDTETITVNAQDTEAVILEHPALKQKAKAWKYIAAACFIPIAFYSFWLPVKTDVLESGMISIKDFNPFYKSTAGSYKPTEFPKITPRESESTLEESISNLPEDVKIYSYKYDDDFYIPIRIPRKTAVLENTVDSKGSNTSENASFEFIVGCFSSESNANSLVETLKSKGFNAYVLDVKNGLSRISVGNASSESAIGTISEQAKQAGFDGWILKK